MTEQRRHACPVFPCGVTGLPHRILMCRPHWQMVPSALKKQVQGEWEKQQRGEPNVHTAVIQAATSEVNKKVARK